jgi:DNA-binding NarL/FixJ family response regulator
MSNITVSIVEDDSHARQILAGWLRAADGFECVGKHETGEKALAELPHEKPNVVLMDINLPAMSGVECVSRLKPSLPETQFIMLTVYEDSDHIFNALRAGASGYLLKQIPCEELLAALSDVHRGGSPMTGSIARKVVQHFQAGPPKPADNTGLSPRESEVLELLARGYLYKEIAEALRVSVPTVNSHIRHIYEKMHVQSRGQAVAKYAHLAKDEPGAIKASRH